VTHVYNADSCNASRDGRGDGLARHRSLQGQQRANHTRVSSTDFRQNLTGRTRRANRREDLLAPHFVRSVINVGFKRVFTSHSGCHAVVLDVDDRPWCTSPVL
jgi:hypothetical protein